MSLLGNMTVITGADGYAQHQGIATEKTLAVQVKGDDTQTWKLQGSLDEGESWYEIDDSDSVTSAAVDGAPRVFTVSSYSMIRVFVSDTAQTYTAHFKGIDS